MINTTYKQLVGGEQGLLDRRIFASEEIYQQELEQVYGRCWLYLGHECQILKPNDFVSIYMGEDPVLLTRDGKGKFHAFLNMCRHRGNRICRADAGNAPSFMCTYHGWTFATDGKLVGVPGYKEAYFEELDRSQWGLVEVAQIDSYKGLIFGTWDSKAPALLDYLGDQAWELDMTLDRREGGAELIVGTQKWVIPSNWKFPGDNFAGDGYHVPVAHGSAIKMGFGGAGRPEAGASSAQNRVANSSEEINNYYKQHVPELERRLGPERAKMLSGSILTVFPNLSLNFGRQLLHLWHPRGPLKTEIWGNCILDKAAPDAVKKMAMAWHTQTFGPSGFLEQDDMNNWLGGTDTARSRIAQKYAMNLQMGIGRESEVDSGASMYNNRTSEKRQRAFYIRWAEMMDASSWSTVDLKRKYSKW